MRSQRTRPFWLRRDSARCQRRPTWRILVQGHAVIPNVPTYHRLQPSALVGDGFVHASLKFGFHRVQLRLQPFANRLPQHREPPIAPLLHVDVRKAKEVERLRFPFAAPLPLVDRKRTELQKSRLFGMQFQVQLLHSFREFSPKLIGIRFAVKSSHDVVRKSHHDHIAVRALLTPCVVSPRLTVHARRSFLLQREVGHAQRFQVVDVVQKRREPQLLILSCCLTYPLQRTRRVFPARCPGRVLLWQVPFGETPSLLPLLRRLSGIVQRLPRYSGSVRPPRSVRHRRTSLDFPTRPKATAALGGLGTSRFPCEVLAYVHGVSDRVGLWHTSRYRCTRWGLPLSPTASASRRKFLTRLNTRPARSPVNASTLPLQAAPLTRGRCGSLIHFRMTFAFTTPRRFSRRTGEIKWQPASKVAWSTRKSRSQ